MRKKLMKYSMIVFVVMNLLAIKRMVALSQKLNDFSYNTYSQYGEDGIIQKIFEIIGTTSKLCIEFGAYDGITISNTANLLINQKWKGILIEANQEFFKRLISNAASWNCIPICAYVDVDDNSLEKILKKHQVVESIDLLSIDIDGNDYYIFESLHEIRPRVIICEYNPTLPATLDVYQTYGNRCGCSVGALVRLARTKKYSLIALTDCNAFFVVNEEFHKFSLFETNLELLAINKYLKYFATDYDGNYFTVSKSGISPYGVTKPYASVLHGEFVRV